MLGLERRRLELSRFHYQLFDELVGGGHTVGGGPLCHRLGGSRVLLECRRLLQRLLLVMIKLKRRTDRPEEAGEYRFAPCR